MLNPNSVSATIVFAAGQLAEHGRCLFFDDVEAGLGREGYNDENVAVVRADSIQSLDQVLQSVPAQGVILDVDLPLTSTSREPDYAALDRTLLRLRTQVGAPRVAVLPLVSPSGGSSYLVRDMQQWARFYVFGNEGITDYHPRLCRALINYCLQDQRVDRFANERANKGKNASGKPLERLVRALFDSIPGFSAILDAQTQGFPQVQVDVLVENGRNAGLYRLSPDRLGEWIFAECKDYTGHKPAYEVLIKIIEVQKFINGCKSCVLVSPNGFTDNIRLLRAVFARDGFLVCLVDNDLLQPWIIAVDRKMAFESIIISNQTLGAV